MAGGKKKKGRALILLLLAMIVLVGACIWLTDYKGKQTEEDNEENTTEETSIVSLDVNTIKSIYFKNENAEMTLLRDKEGVWKNSEDENFPVNQTYAKSMQDAFTDLTSTRTITEGTDDPVSFGLDSPSILVTVTTEDGKKTDISIGDTIPVGDGYYAVLNGGKEVYVISADFYNLFTHKVEEMVEVEPIPSLNAADITYLSVENKDKPAFEVSYDENNYADYSGFTKWTMKQPYTTDIAADADALGTLFGNYSGLSFLTCVDYNAKDLSKYGLDNPAAVIRLKYNEAATDSNTADTADAGTADDANAAGTEKTERLFELLIGSTDADGNYYAKQEDSNAVHTMSADTVSKLIDIDAYGYVYCSINLFHIDLIDSVKLELDGETYTLRIERPKADAGETSEESTDAGDESAAVKYYFNGNPAEEKSFKELYQKIIAPVTEKEIPSDYSGDNTGKTPYLTLEFHFTAGQTVTVKYLPYDESYYIVDTDGAEYFLTDLRVINDLADAVRNYAK